MGCCNILPVPNLGCENRLETGLKSLSFVVGKQDRKILKLLNKQYFINSIEVKPQDVINEIIICQSPFIINYTDGVREFYWEFKTE